LAGSMPAVPEQVSAADLALDGLGVGLEAGALELAVADGRATDGLVPLAADRLDRVTGFLPVLPDGLG
jgi:hypothetical protein